MAHTDFPYLEANNEKYNANQGRVPLQDNGKSQWVRRVRELPVMVDNLHTQGV